MWGVNEKWAVWEINEMHIVRGCLRFRVCRYMWGVNKKWAV